MKTKVLFNCHGLLVASAVALLFLPLLFHGKSCAPYLARRSIAEASVSASQFNKTIWVGNAVHSVDSKKDYGKIVILKLGNELMRNNPDMNRAEIQNKLNSVYSEYQNKIEVSHGNYRVNSNIADATTTILGIVKDTSEDPRLQVGADVIDGMVKWGIKLYEHYEAPNTQVTAQNELASGNETLQTEVAGVMEESWDLAHADPRNAKVVDGLTSNDFGSSVMQDGKTILKNNPGFLDAKVAQAMIAGINPDGTVRLKEDDLKTYAQGKLSEFEGILTKTTNQLQASQSQLDKLVAQEKAKEIRAAMKAKAEAEERAYQLEMGSAKSSVYILSTLIGFTNPKLGQQVGGVGNAAIQIVNSVHQFNQAIEGASKLGTAMSSAILTGNILGATMSLVSLFNHQPSVDQIILDQVHQLRLQIADLGAELNQRFDRVDKALNQIYSDMEQNFEIVEAEIAAGRTDLAGVQEKLIEIESRMNSMELNLYGAIDAGFKRQLSGYEASCFEDRDHLRLGMVPQDSLINCLSEFRIYSSEFSRDPLASRTPNPILSSDAWSADGIPAAMILQELSYPLETNLNILASLAAAPALKLNNASLQSLGRIPNPVEWARGAQAYIDLLSSKWGRLGRILPIGNTQRLIDTGQVLEQFSQAVATEDDFDGTHAKESFFLKLLDNYRAKSKRLGQLIDVKMNARYAKRATGRFPMADDPEHSDGGYVAPQLLNDNSGENNYPQLVGMRLFPEIFSSIPPVYKFAHQIGVGTILVSAYVDVIASGGQENRYSLNPRNHCDESDRCRLELVVKVDYINNSKSKFAELLVNKYTFKDHPPYYTGPLRSEDNQHMADVLKQRLNSYGNYAQFIQDVTFHDKLMIPQKGSIYGKIWIFPEDLMPKVKEAQAEAQRTYAKDLHEYAVDKDILAAADELSAAKELLDAFISVGLPETFKENDKLRSYLLGRGGLVDRDELVDEFKHSESGTISKLALHFDAESNKRIDAFGHILASALKDIHGPQVLPIVQSTMKQLTLLLNAQEAAKPSSYSVDDAYKKADAELDNLLQ